MMVSIVEFKGRNEGDPMELECLLSPRLSGSAVEDRYSFQTIDQVLDFLKELACKEVGVVWHSPSSCYPKPFLCVNFRNGDQKFEVIIKITKLTKGQDADKCLGECLKRVGSLRDSVNRMGCA